jgi:hypothetical protein
MTLSQSPAAGTLVGVGTHTITVTATDAAGNSATCATTFTVEAVLSASGPTDQVRFAEQSASFSTSALGTEPFRYQWRKDGVDIAGATTPIYNIESVSTADSGTYCVVVSGPCNSVTNCATLTVYDCLPLTASAPQFNPQTSLFEQKVRVTNPTTFTLSAVKVSIRGLREGVQVFNAAGDLDGVPFVQFDQELSAVQTADLTIEYYVKDRQGFEAQLCAKPVLKSSSIEPEGTAVKIERAQWLADGTFMIEFSAVPGQVYHIQYCDDMRTWKSAGPGGTSSANRIQWIDNGQPKTESFPSKQLTRFYRIITAQ